MADSQSTKDPIDAAINSPAQGAETLRENKEDEEQGEEDEEDVDTKLETDTGVEGAERAKKKRKSKKKKKNADSTGVAVSEPDRKDMSQLPKPVPMHDIPALLQQLALSQSSKKEGKAPEDYKFWNTQPVPKFKEPNLLQTTSGSNGEELPEGAILPDEVCKASIKPAPEPLLADFQWCDVDLNDKDELNELYELLYNHYVEDKEGSFRFNYSTQFLTWALKPPGWRKEWHIGVRTKPVEGKKGRLVAFIAGTPAVLKVRSHTFKASEINFLIIHRKLREKRLAPLLIKEITRRCYQVGIYQALYTAGILLPTPVSTCRYFHRSLDWEHLYKNGFSHLPHGSTETRQKYKYRLEAHPQLKGFRPMKKEDVPAARDLLQRYVERFSLRQEFSEEEFEHFMCSPASKDVVWSYVVEHEDKITDFISYYLLESTVLRPASGSQKTDTIRAAYLYYYATESAFQPIVGPKLKPAAIQSNLQHRLQQLIHDALILANKDKFHVFNALTLLDNPLFLREEKFEPGDGNLHYYLFNWRTAKVPGGIDESKNVDIRKMGGIGVVML